LYPPLLAPITGRLLVAAAAAAGATPPKQFPMVE